MSNTVLHCQDRFEKAIEELIQGGDLKDRVKKAYQSVWTLKDMNYVPEEYLVHFNELEIKAALLGLYQKNDVNQVAKDPDEIAKIEKELARLIFELYRDLTIKYYKGQP